MRFAIGGGLWLDSDGRTVTLIQWTRSNAGAETRVTVDRADLPTLYAAIAEALKHGEDDR